jgi:hypothetical protein
MDFKIVEKLKVKKIILNYLINFQKSENNLKIDKKYMIFFQHNSQK